MSAMAGGGPWVGGASGSETGGLGGSSALPGSGGKAGQSGDAASDAECPAVSAAPDVDPWTQRMKSAGFGGIETQSSGAHNDVFLESPTHYIRLGVRLDWGGTVVFYGLSANAASNVRIQIGTSPIARRVLAARPGRRLKSDTRPATAS